MTDSSITAEFPSHTPAETLADGAVHVSGLVAGSVGVAWLAARLWPGATVAQFAVVAVYGTGLLGMLSASALYNFTAPGRRKAIFRRLDHAMIFVMIAGSYTPFALTVLPPRLGVPLCALVWALALIGVGLKLALGNRYDALFLLFYLCLGWMVVGVGQALWVACPATVLALLLAGGIAYSIGLGVHAHGRLPFHNAIWHALVLVAAGLHFAAICLITPVPHPLS